MTRSRHLVHSAQGGFTLIELMIAMVLGLLVVGAAGSLFLSNQRVYGSTEALSRIQENQRSAFEMLARDVREAGGNPCTRNIVNMLDTSRPGGSYYTNWVNGVGGSDGTGANGADADEIILTNANDGAVLVTKNETPSANVEVTSTAGFADNDILMVCNSEVAAIFQATQLNSAGGAGGSIQHNSGESNPGNLMKPFQIDQDTFDKSVGGSNAPGYCFLPETPKNSNCLNDPSGSPAQVVRPQAIRWFLADNGRGGTSLYRQVITNGGATVGAAGEIAEGVTGMQITYKIGSATNYVNASAVAAGQWALVSAVNVQMDFEAVQGAMSQTMVEGTDGDAISRTMNDFIVLRNHVEIQ